MSSETMTIRLSGDEKKLICEYARANGFSVSEFMRSCALERIEDELDLQAWNRAKAQFEADPVTIPASEIEAKYL